MKLPNYIKGKTLHEKQMLYYNGSHCPYCNNPTEFVDSTAVYGKSYGMMYLCKKCEAWVNVHSDSDDRSFGFVAKKDLRELRHKCHQLFDPLWQLKMKAGVKRGTAQRKARAWLSQQLSIDTTECHFGMMDNEQCMKVIGICEGVYKMMQEKQSEREIKSMEVAADAISSLTD